jgi:hypothetical protein
MDDERTAYWFPAKRYGWGWGPPCRWQGWAVLTVWLVVLLAGALTLARHRHGPVAHVLWVAAMSLALLCVAYWKGEPPRWRWGER